MSGTVLTRVEHSIDDGDGRERSVGRVRVGIELRILDENDREVPRGTPGQICIRGETLMAGYWNPSRRDRGDAGERLAAHRRLRFDG